MSADQMVGADPSMGSAANLSCEIKEDRLTDAGTAGDGHDVNCLTPLSSLPETRVPLTLDRHERPQMTVDTGVLAYRHPRGKGEGKGLGG